MTAPAPLLPEAVEVTTLKEWAEQLVKITAEVYDGHGETLADVLASKYWSRCYHDGMSPMRAADDNLEGAIPSSVWDVAKKKLGIKPNGYLP